MKTFNSESLVLAVDSHFGIYSAQTFVQRFKDCVVNPTNETEGLFNVLLKGPDHEEYLDAWNDLTNESLTFRIDGVEYSIYESEDIWLIPSDMEYPQEF